MNRSPIHPRCIWNLPVLAAVILIALALFLGCSERLWRRWHTLDASLPELSAPLKPGEHRVWMAYTPTDFILADTPSEGPAVAGQVCAYFSVTEPISAYKQHKTPAGYHTSRGLCSFHNLQPVVPGQGGDTAVVSSLPLR